VTPPLHFGLVYPRPLVLSCSVERSPGSPFFAHSLDLFL
jgi:hypothetical protein